MAVRQGGGGTQPAASVIVLNYNGRSWLDACLASVLGQELEGGVEVILVDNASSDGSVEQVQSRFPDVKVVTSGRNLGFAAGNNLGLHHARGRFRVLLNNDTVARPGWLRAMVAAAVEEPRAGAIAGKLLFLDRPGVIQNAGSYLLSDGSGADRGSGEPDQGQYERREEVFAACGASMLLRTEMLQAVGGLDGTFFTYYEDTDLCWRMRLQGWKVVYEPTAVVEHAHSATAVDGSPFKYFHADRNRLFMVIKNGSPRFVARTFRGFARRAAGMTKPAAAVNPVANQIRAQVRRQVVQSFAAHLPEMLGKRLRVRMRRRIPDSEIERLLYPRELWDARSA